MPYPSTVEIVVKDQGVTLAIWTVLPVPDGSSFFYWISLPLEPMELQPGYELWVTQGAVTLSMTIPTLTGLAYPLTDILSGAAPASAALTGYLFPYGDPEQVYTATASASASGTYQMTWPPPVDLRPRDSGYLLYAQDAVRQTYVRFIVPFLRLQVNGPEISGLAAPNQTLHLSVENASGAPLADFDASSDSYGSFSYYYSCGDGWVACIFSPTDRVIAVAGGQTFSMTVINVTAQADLLAGLVSGQAPTLQPVEVLRFGGLLGQWVTGDLWHSTPLSQVIVTAMAGGGYAAALPLQAGDYGAALVTTPDGNQAYARYVVPYLHARLGKFSDYVYGWERMWGYISDRQPLTPITVEVQGPSGYLKDWYTIWADKGGRFFDYGYSDADLALESGDRITLTTPQGAQIFLLLPILTAEADPHTDIVSGQAPPFSQVVVTIDYDRQLTVTADFGGQYSADFSSLGGFFGYAEGEATWTSPEGYDVARHFKAAPEEGLPCPPHLVSAQVGGTGLYLAGDYTCGQITFRLRSVDGQVKFKHVYPGNPGYIDLYDENGRPVLLLTGDQIEIDTGGQVKVSVVPVLTVNLDPHTDQVSGQTPPFAVIDLWSEEQSHYLTTTANAQGAYVFDLAGIVDLDAGSYLQVTLHSRPSFYAYGVIPVLDTVLYSPLAWGRLQPFTPYTITLFSPLTVSAPITGYASGSGYYPAGPYPPPVGIHGNPGDRVTMETPNRVWDMSLPFLTARVDAAAGLISGQAPPASHLAINLSIDYQPSIETVITATASGTYSASFGVPPGPLRISGYVTHFTAFDMRTYLNFASPSWYVTLGSGMVSGRAPVYGGPITVTLQSYDSAFSQEITSSLRQNDFSLEFQRPIRPGDRLTMYIPDGLASEFTVPHLSAVHDFTRRVLEGWVPPGGELMASIPSGFGAALRHVRLMPDGRFGVDTSDLEPVVGDRGYIQYTDRLGNTAIYPFTIRGYPAYLPLIRLLAPFP